MKTSTSAIILILLILLGLGAFVYSNYRKYTPATYVQESTDANGATTTTTVNTETGTSTPGAPIFTLAQIAQHTNATSCYSAILGKVYDLTMWINLHPGGPDKILSICGIDGTAKFMAQHHGAQKQMSILARYYIGNLSQ
jgi:cytochrome b involved in lipid metabolism